MTKQQTEQLSVLCAHPGWNTLMTIMQEKLDHLHEQLESNPLDKIARLQGQVEEVKALMALRKNINSKNL